ncbi:MAG TPA: hypothetical protein VNY31_09655 [Solirubrobacteraceae bacterium]|nr:hypothetical protein [Solirubrobacteraceae bacterium]
MSARAPDPWRLPAIERFGGQLRRLENAASTPLKIPRARVSRLAILLFGGGIAAALICIFLILTTGRIAEARNAVDEAPGAAERSRTVRFESVRTITLDDHVRAAERASAAFVLEP